MQWVWHRLSLHYWYSSIRVAFLALYWHTAHDTILTLRVARPLEVQTVVPDTAFDKDLVGRFAKQASDPAAAAEMLESVGRARKAAAAAAEASAISCVLGRFDDGFDSGLSIDLFRNVRT